jgi:hypothetical protein
VNGERAACCRRIAQRRSPREARIQRRRPFPRERRVCPPTAGLARTAQPLREEARMGRALQVIRTRELEELFGYFGLEAEPALVSAHRDRIAQRFAVEVREIVRLCKGLRERERFTLFREALRLAYGSATLGRAQAAVPSGRGPGAAGDAILPA